MLGTQLTRKYFLLQDEDEDDEDALAQMALLEGLGGDEVRSAHHVQAFRPVIWRNPGCRVKCMAASRLHGAGVYQR